MCTECAIYIYIYVYYFHVQGIFVFLKKTLEPQISNRCLRWELESNNLEGARLFFNLTCLFFNLRGSVFISKQTPPQHFLQNIWSVIWPNIYTPENYFAGIQLWVVYFFAYFSYWLFSVFSYIALVEAVRFAWCLYLNWWWDRGPQRRQMYFFSCGRICMVQVVCKAIHWSIMLEKVCSQCLASRIRFRISLTSLCFQCLQCW